jgi:hypothetical protein
MPQMVLDAKPASDTATARATTLAAYRFMLLDACWMTNLLRSTAPEKSTAVFFSDVDRRR